MSNKKILQTGLYSRSDKEVEQLVSRVTKFNSLNLGSPIQMDIMPYEEGDKEGGMDFPHYKLRFLYPNEKARDKFWTGSY